MKTSYRLCIALAAFAALAYAYDFAGLKPEGYVSDFARVIDPASRAELERYADTLKSSTGAEVAFVTVPALDGEPIEDVANTLFRKWGIGQKGTNEGLLLLLVPNDRKFRMEVGYGLEPIIPDGYAGSVLRAMRPALREGQYGEALLDAAHEIGAHIAQAKGVSLNAQEPVRQHRHRPESGIPPVLVFLGGLFVFWMLAGVMGSGRRRMGGGFGGGFLPGLILGNVLGRSWDHRRSGGGFGGFDSHDSFGGFGGGSGGFGGFGGGDSGGGGASSSW